MLLWVAGLAVTWFVASVVAALVLGRYLRRCAEGVAGSDDALRPLDTGPLRIWLHDLSRLPEGLGSVPAPRDQTGADQRREAGARAGR